METRRGEMATSSFNTKFIIKDPKALENLKKALDNTQPYTPTHDADKAIHQGVEKLKQSLSRSE